MEQQALSLYELNGLVKRSIRHCLPDAYWVQAELSDVRSNYSGHCYLEFIQKEANGNNLIAKARGTIWSNVYKLLKPYFEQETGQAFTSGIKVLVQVSVEFHELYGYSLTVLDIDPTYTVGDMERKRREILRQLEEEGVIDLNKELEFPMFPQRIAVISSATAAGYGDFCNQLVNNLRGYAFHTELFPAIMQGERVEESIIAALDTIYHRINEFDIVVIIRGGGATSDLSGFDTYLLAASCAQFPLPIITGIGHERDDTVIDLVAHRRVKTPTAAAEYLIACMDKVADKLDDLTFRLQESVRHRLLWEHRRMESLKQRIPSVVYKRISDAKYGLLSSQRNLQMASRQFISMKKHRLELLQQRLNDALPEKQLARGYSITLKNGKVVKDASVLKEGDMLVTMLHQGKIETEIRNINLPQIDTDSF
ncbi:MAG: exodeoxyribonuclease VII large subunit [Bacteroidaceae bacterium]|nr:exodeoxyribonuclease VII large subunit [Bacteroidaceae bacterium]